MELLDRLAALSPFGTGLSQHARLITLASAQDGTLPQALMAERFQGREAINELYRFDVDALSTSTDLDLDEFIGEELTVTLLQPDDSRRAWHGICTAAEWLGADGGVARYRLRLEPALALLRLRRDSYIFQDRNLRDVVTELFADYPQLRFEFDLSQELAPRPIITQYRESDYEFLVRLLASEGLSWRFEHDQALDASDGQARHKLVIFDSQAALPDTPGSPMIRFHGMRATDSDDAIDQFRARRRAAANAVAISSWDPAQLLAPGAEQTTGLDAGELASLTVYDGSGERIASDSADAHSALMLRALELENKLFEGEGAVRRLAPGCAFQLTQHDRYGDGENAFKVLWVEHTARNNIDAHIAHSGPDDIEPGTYRNRFGCVRDAVSIVPHASALPHPHTALGPQTALVVGVPDAVATTMRDHQVRVQFAWQRGKGANMGGSAHDVDPEGNAPGDDRSGTWVRVAEALAGPNWGSQFTPRIGTEVLVDFIENDIDRPLVVAQLYNGADTPPFAAGVDSGVNHAGTISGIHTRTFDGGGYNQWQLDDTQGQLRMRLATSTAASQLNLGYLIQQAPGSAQRGRYRGSGFELRTEAWAVVRGAEGVFLTTRARSAQGSGVISTQLDTAEAVASLETAQTLDKTLLGAASGQQALSSEDAVEAQKDLLAQIDHKEKGKYAGTLNGQEGFKAKAGGREADSAAPVEKFASPLVVMDAQAAVNWATPASSVLFAGQQVHWTTQADLHLSAAHTVSTVAAEAASVYAHEGGIQAFAGNGPVSLQAHTDTLEVLADKELVVVSVNDNIEISAAEKIVLTAGESSITLDGSNIRFECPGNFTVRSGTHVFSSAGKAEVVIPPLPDSTVHAVEEFAPPIAPSKFMSQLVVLTDASGHVLANRPYRVWYDDSRCVEGVSDMNGSTAVLASGLESVVQIEVLKRRR
jgi:type VI secretion system secreted protein VgrG